MHVPRPSQETAELFRSLVPEAQGVAVKPMFANVAAFVNGNMFAGTFGDVLGVRLPDDREREELLAVEGAGPYGPAERPMGGYVAFPEAWRDEPDRMRAWIERALVLVAELPPKQPKPRGSRRPPA